MRETLPSYAAWRFVDAVEGFEVAFPEPGRLRGHTSAVEAGLSYAVRYEIEFDEQWRTRHARVWSDTLEGRREVVIASDGTGSWTLDGHPAAHLDGLIDIDIEASACTNTLPVHRLSLPAGDTVAAPAVFVRALDLDVVRLDQTYRRLDAHRFDYTAPDGFTAVLRYDDVGLVVDYPGLARRVQ